MRWMVWTTIIVALSPVMFYGCDRAARASEVVIWELQLSDGTVVSFGDMDFKECTEQLRLITKTIPEVTCVPRQVEREKA